MATRDLGDARRDNGLRARRGAPEVAAGLERDVERGAARSFAGLAQGHDLGVRAAAAAACSPRRRPRRPGRARRRRPDWGWSCLGPGEPAQEPAPCNPSASVFDNKKRPRRQHALRACRQRRSYWPSSIRTIPSALELPQVCRLRGSRAIPPIRNWRSMAPHLALKVLSSWPAYRRHGRSIAPPGAL